MPVWMEFSLAIFASVLASNGLWSFIQKKQERKDIRAKLLLGLAHDRIIFLGTKYLDQGHISHTDYENLHDYLYLPYKEMGGNGSAKKIMEAVEKLEIKNS